MFDINPWEMLIIASLVLIIFGPERLPELFFRAGRLLRQFRQMTESATEELTRELRAAAEMTEAQVGEPLRETLNSAKAAASLAPVPPGAPAVPVAGAPAAEEPSAVPDDLPSIAPPAPFPPLVDGPAAPVATDRATEPGDPGAGEHAEEA